MPVGDHLARLPALPWQVAWEDADYPPAPRIDEHGAALRTEFAATKSPPF
jgi:hypothetical protein